MNKRRKGFTLIELLAVIVILGLLMAIAIPSVTKYITQSRKKTVSTTIGNYMGALTNQVNDMEYVFTASNTIYAVPIECIALERGGTNPFGKWHQSNDTYWAYVLVQYDDATSSYTYGFTFKDSAGYGLYPTTSEKLKESGSQINTDLDLNRPTNGTITNITAKANWTGFNLKDDTNLVVLEATSEGEIGDGKTTCTLCQKGKNYETVEQEKGITLSNSIKKDNTLITNNPTLTKSFEKAGDVSGLYSSIDTNSGQPTYYFRGSITNNYVSFAGLTWKIVRINEDGTIRLILNGRIAANYYNSTYSDYNDMYYSNSDTAKQIVDNWYKTNITDKGYDSYVVTGMFCEQAKAKFNSTDESGNAAMKVYNSYTPSFKCEADGNGKGIINSKVGLITYDEIVYAGGYYNNSCSNYLRDQNGVVSSYSYWTMSPGGYATKKTTSLWIMNANGFPTATVNVTPKFYYRPVINLNSNVKVTGTGMLSDPYVIKTN